MEMTHNYKTRNYLMLNDVVLEIQGLTKWWCSEIAPSVDNGHAHNTITNSYQRFDCSLPSYILDLSTIFTKLRVFVPFFEVILPNDSQNLVS
jgi:hypothetical protein